MSIELKASNVTIRFDLDHDHDLELSRSNMEFPISQPKVVRLPRNKKQTYRLNSRPQTWPKGLTLTITLTFAFWRSNVTLTFDHTHDLDHGFSWSNFEIALSQNGRANWHCVTNQPRISDWVVQVPLWPSGLGVGLWSERPGGWGSIPPRSVTLVAAVTQVHLWVDAPGLGWKWPEPGGSDFKKGGIM